MKSMTGYGKGVASRDFREITVEIRAVNNRYLEINARFPKNFLACDELVRGLIPKYLSRGTVDVFFSYQNTKSTKGVTADFELIKEYQKLAEQINQELSIPDDLSFCALMRNSEIIIPEQKVEDMDIILELTGMATIEALKNLDEMREVEGEAIFHDLMRLISELESYLDLSLSRAPIVVEEYRTKIRERVTEFLGEIEIDQARLLNEVAFFADKSDVNEELNRLSSHISQFKVAASTQLPSGRKLDFICQEIGREINTLGSKSNDIVLTGYVIEMKNILEKIKEQIRNVE